MGIELLISGGRCCGGSGDRNRAIMSPRRPRPSSYLARYRATDLHLLGIRTRSEGELYSCKAADLSKSIFQGSAKNANSRPETKLYVILRNLIKLY